MQERLIVVGVSLGGLSALQTLATGLPLGLPAAVAVVQHRTDDADDPLCTLLAEAGVWPVHEALDKDAIECGHLYLAPPGYHLLVEHGSFALSTDAPVNQARPSVDVLFDSAAAAYGAAVVGVILTGEGRDGAAGAARVKACGGVLVVEDPATATARSMPAAALGATAADYVVPIEAIARVLAQVCAGQGREQS